MRKVVVILFLLWAGYAFIGNQLAAEDLPWFDMEKCEMCRTLLDDPDLLNNMDWEHHKIANGLVTVTTVRDEYLPSYHETIKKMNELAGKLMQGEQHYLCGMCTNFGILMMKGVKYELIETNHGTVEIMTSDNPEIVAEIHAFADRTQAEIAKFMEAEKAEKKEEKH